MNENPPTYYKQIEEKVELEDVEEVEQEEGVQGDATSVSPIDSVLSQ